MARISLSDVLRAHQHFGTAASQRNSECQYKLHLAQRQPMGQGSSPESRIQALDFVSCLAGWIKRPDHNVVKFQMNNMANDCSDQ
ncbi:hypothetical protein KIL84_002047 [Mauremys mutica]|uniref:Uncharacterized protein n=1 Tax=Mauremys mutica TaxID=74926 RepID=A0A9D3XJL0_9SAUR|nr:hypothetical protein KIL84_002047 [Mauremys mutica]